MNIKYAIVDKNTVSMKSAIIADLDNDKDFQYQYVYDLLNVDTAVGTYSDDKYFACAFPKDWYGDFTQDNMCFAVVKINTAEYNKRVEESAKGYHQGMFWLWNEMFESFEAADEVPAFEKLYEQTGM